MIRRTSKSVTRGGIPAIPLTPENIFDLSLRDGRFESPINITLDKVVVCELDDIKWYNIDQQPRIIKLTNTGQTVLLSAKWSCPRPGICCGPFVGSYVFSKLHFHWGETNLEGSEHMVNSKRYPMEIHATFYKSSYLTQEEALKRDDGIVMLVYFLKLQPDDNPVFEEICKSLKDIAEPFSSTKMEKFLLPSFLPYFTLDYILYWGNIATEFESSKGILWTISRMPVGISGNQIEAFRQIRSTELVPLTKNYREVKETGGRTVIHVSPSLLKDSFLYLLPFEMFEMAKQGNKKPGAPPKTNEKRVAAVKRQGRKGGTIAVHASYDMKATNNPTGDFFESETDDGGSGEWSDDTNPELTSSVAKSFSMRLKRSLSDCENRLLKSYVRVCDNWETETQAKLTELKEFLEAALVVVNKTLKDKRIPTEIARGKSETSALPRIPVPLSKCKSVCDLPSLASQELSLEKLTNWMKMIQQLPPLEEDHIFTIWERKDGKKKRKKSSKKLGRFKSEPILGGKPPRVAGAKLKPLRGFHALKTLLAFKAGQKDGSKAGLGGAQQREDEFKNLPIRKGVPKGRKVQFKDFVNVLMPNNTSLKVPTHNEQA